MYHLLRIFKKQVLINYSKDIESDFYLINLTTSSSSAVNWRSQLQEDIINVQSSTSAAAFFTLTNDDGDFCYIWK